MYVIFKVSYNTSLTTAVIIGITGFVKEYLKPLISKNNGQDFV
jgi:hypothetical protein